MTIAEIYTYFDKIGCLTFATVDNDYPETRIAHLRGCDDEGIYFMTMYTKPFYKQLKETGKLSICGLHANTHIEERDDGSPIFDAGYFARLTGDVKEVSLEDIKAKNNPIFDFCIADQEQYKSMVFFVIYRAKGEIYDYDFEKEHRENKLQRLRFSYGGFPIVPVGLHITDACIGCGQCQENCSFLAIEPTADGDKFQINGARCDECGDCFLSCPVEAVVHKGK